LNGRKPAQLLPRPVAAIDPAVWHNAEELRRQQPDPLAEPRALARFLCGLTSPRLTRSRLTRDKLFGALEHVPFPEVLRRAGQAEVGG
jgi:ATP-dependent DNA helicase RecQ